MRRTALQLGLRKQPWLLFFFLAQEHWLLDGQTS